MHTDKDILDHPEIDEIMKLGDSLTELLCMKYDYSVRTKARRNIVRILGRLELGRYRNNAIQCLSSALFADADWLVRANAAQSLWMIEGSEIIPILEKGLKIICSDIERNSGLCSFDTSAKLEYDAVVGEIEQGLKKLMYTNDLNLDQGDIDMLLEEEPKKGYPAKKNKKKRKQKRGKWAELL
jgi:hypothetical protein